MGEGVHEEIGFLLLDPSSDLRRNVLPFHHSPTCNKESSASGDPSPGFLCHDLFALLCLKWVLSHFPHPGLALCAKTSFQES